MFSAHSTSSPKRKNWLGTFVDIAKGGRRTIETGKAVATMVEVHKEHKRAREAMKARGAEAAEVKEATDAYLLRMAVAFRDMVMKNGGFQVKVGQMLSMNSAIFPEVADRAGKGCEIPNFKGSYLGRFPLVLADFSTSDHLSERSRP